MVIDIRSRAHEPADRGRDVAAVLLRAAVGTTMIVHGRAHARSLDGTARWFSSIGFRQPALQARASAVVEIAGGAMVVAGAATPLAAASVVGTMTVAARAVHQRNGFLITKEGWEYVGNLAVAAVALAAVGPGPFSVDRALGVGRRSRATHRAALAAGLGLAAGAAQLATFWRPQPD